MIYTLKRRYFDHGTFSELSREDDSKVCAMVEREWANNRPSVSCVPEGFYQWLPTSSPKYGDCYYLEAPELGVTLTGPSLRTHILTHVANAPFQLEGCLAPGEMFGVPFIDGSACWGVISSQKAFDSLMGELGGKDHTLIIEKA